ncbi:unnamed protein product, partial [Mesorhabditis belari]|uniref:Uncharacterized protein n=1 Tax=Mesorhabditis belari TaxID=2138241 RepID=A0AAF3EED2_9BILA
MLIPSLVVVSMVSSASVVLSSPSHSHPSPIHLIRRPHSSQEILLNSLQKQQQQHQNNKAFHSLSCQNSPSTPHPMISLPVVQPRGTGTTMSSALRQVRSGEGTQPQQGNTAVASQNPLQNHMQMLLKNQFAHLMPNGQTPFQTVIPRKLSQTIPQPVAQQAKNSDQELRDLLLRREMQIRDKLEASLMPHLSSMDREKFLPSLIGIGSAAPAPPILPMALTDAIAEQKKFHEMQALRAAGLSCDSIPGSSSSSITLRSTSHPNQLNEALLLHHQHQQHQQLLQNQKANAKQAIDSLLQIMNGLLRFCEVLRTLYDKQPGISLEPAGWPGLPPPPFTHQSVHAVCSAWNWKKKLIESKQALRNVEEHRKSEDSQAFGSYNATLLAFIAAQEKDVETAKAQYNAGCQILFDHLWVRFVSDQTNVDLFKYFTDQIKVIFDLGIPETPRSSPTTSKSLTPATPVPPVPTAPDSLPPQLIPIPIPSTSQSLISSLPSSTSQIRTILQKNNLSDEPSTSEEPTEKKRRIEGANIPSDPVGKKTETEKLSETIITCLMEVEEERKAYFSLKHKRELILCEKRRFMLELQKCTQQRDNAKNEKERNEWEMKRKEMEERIQSTQMEWINIGQQAAQEDGKGLMTLKKVSQMDEEREELLFKLDRLRQVIVGKNNENEKFVALSSNDPLRVFQTPQLTQHNMLKKHLLLRMVELMKMDTRFRDLGMKTLQQIAITQLILMPELRYGKINVARGDGPLITTQMVSEFLGGSLEKDEIETFARELSVVADCVLNDSDVQLRMGYIMMHVNEEYHNQLLASGQKDWVIPSEISERIKKGIEEERVENQGNDGKKGDEDEEIDIEGDEDGNGNERSEKGEERDGNAGVTEKFINGTTSS